MILESLSKMVNFVNNMSLFKLIKTINYVMEIYPESYNFNYDNKKGRGRRTLKNYTLLVY